MSRGYLKVRPYINGKVLEASSYLDKYFKTPGINEMVVTLDAVNPEIDYEEKESELEKF